MKPTKLIVESVFKQMAAENRAKKAAADKEYKDHVKARSAEAKSAAADKAKNKYQHIATIVNTEVANHYPDADPFESIASKVQKHYGHDYYSVMPHLDKAVKQHLGSKSYNAYVEDFDKDYRKDNGPVHEAAPWTLMHSFAADRFEHIPAPFKSHEEEYQYFAKYHNDAFEKFKAENHPRAGGAAWDLTNDHREKVAAHHDLINGNKSTLKEDTDNVEHTEGTIHSIEDVPGSGGAKKFVIHGNDGKPIMFNDTRQGHTIKQVTPSKKVGDKVKVKHIYSGYHSLPFDQV